jgi:succinate dehydrogenase / fumarate reductase membrane anchor subunit
MSLVSPLRRVLGAGPARSGVHHWWMQRLTSLALVPLSIWFVASLLFLPGFDHLTVIAWIARGWTALLLMLFILSSAWHSNLGLQVIIEDYVHTHGTKTLLLVLVSFSHVLAAAAALFAILKIAFGAAA